MEWISVEDRLPMEGQLCAIYGPFSLEFQILTATFEGMQCPGKDIYLPRFITTWGRGTTSATHWMSLSKPPVK